MLYAAASSSPGRSWAGLIALAVAFALFRVGTYVWSKTRRPSPAPALPSAKRVKVQASVGVTDDEPTPEPGWWGRIVEIGGVRMRQVRQVVKTGSHELPPPADEPPGDDLDVPLDDEQDEQEAEEVEEYIARARGLRVPYGQIVRVVVEHYGVSESTAKRRIREVDETRRVA